MGVLRPENWPYPPTYTAMCEEVMARIGIRPENREALMRQMTQAHGAPLQHLEALEVAVRWDGTKYSETAVKTAHLK